MILTKVLSIATTLSPALKFLTSGPTSTTSPAMSDTVKKKRSKHLSAGYTFDTSQKHYIMDTVTGQNNSSARIGKIR